MSAPNQLLTINIPRKPLAKQPLAWNHKGMKSMKNKGLVSGFLTGYIGFPDATSTGNEILQRRNQMERCFLVLLKLHKGKDNKDDKDNRNNSKHSLIIHYLPNSILSEHLISSFIPHNNLWLLSVITGCKSSTYHSTQKIALEKKNKKKNPR